jgi:hypothetical protein
MNIRKRQPIGKDEAEGNEVLAHLDEDDKKGKEQLVKDVFEMHKRWIEEGLEQAKSYAEDCDFKSVLQNFYKATLALKGLEAVFTVDVPEVRAYIEQRKAEVTKKDIPELVNILQQKCKIQK